MIFEQQDVLAFEYFNKGKFVAMPIEWLENEFDYVDSPLVKFLKVYDEGVWRSLASKGEYVKYLEKNGNSEVKYDDELNYYIEAYNNDENIKVIVDSDITLSNPDYQLVDITDIYEWRDDYDSKELVRQSRHVKEYEEGVFLADLSANNLAIIDGRKESYNKGSVEAWISKSEVVRRRIKRNQPYEDIKVFAVFQGKILELSYGEVYKRQYELLKKS